MDLPDVGLATFEDLESGEMYIDPQLKAIAAAHHGKVTLFAHNLRTGQTAAVMPDEPVQTASR